VYVDEGSGSENLTVKSSNDILRCRSNLRYYIRSKIFKPLSVGSTALAATVGEDVTDHQENHQIDLAQP